MSAIDKPQFNIRFFSERPGPGTRYIISMHSKDILSTILNDISTYTLKENLKQKCYDQLYNLIICCEQKVKPLSDQILKQMYKTILDEDAYIKERSKEIAQSLGFYVDTDYIIPIILEHMKDKDSVSLPHYISSCLYVLADVVLFSTANYTSLNSHIPNILEMISNSDFLNSDSVKVLESLLMLTTNIVRSCGTEYLFKILLQLGSVPGTAHLHHEVENTISHLARNCGCSTSSELFSMELSSLLEELKETYLDWTDNSADRFIFSMLCRKSNEAVVDHWDTILEIVGMNCIHGKQYSVRMDMLSLVEHFLDKESLQDTLCYYGDVFIRGILRPCIEWRSGIPNVKIREAAILCLKKLLEKKLIEQEAFQRNFLDIFNNLKGCLDDDFSSDIRYASIVLLRLMISFTGVKMEYDDYKEVYPELLKRLDDSQDGIRLEAAKSFEDYFEVLPEEWAPNLFEYMVENIYIHLDDSEEIIQQAITKVLKQAAKVHKDVVINIGTAMSSKFKHQFAIDSLLSQLKESN